MIEPNGTEIYFANPTSSTGGSLDHDVVCTAGTETTSWASNAPRGTYVVWAVSSATGCGGPTSVGFTLNVSQGNSVILSRTGNLSEGQESARVSFTN